MLKVAIKDKTQQFMDKMKEETDERKKLDLWDDYMEDKQTQELKSKRRHAFKS